MIATVVFMLSVLLQVAFVAFISSYWLVLGAHSTSCVQHMWRSEDILQKAVLAFYHEDLVVRLRGTCLYVMCHFAGWNL